MIIKKMTACFGVLENESLSLGPGLNIICAPNESGKSTWCALIRAVLYGINSAQREKNGVKPEKVLYAPWSGLPMYGELELEREGQEITISRSTKRASAPMREFRAVYTGTSREVPGLTGADAGQRLTGMPREVFDRSVFVTQGGLGVDNHAELEKRIAAIVSTGEEGASYTMADDCLRAWQRKRRFRQSGAIPALAAETQALAERIERMDGAIRERDELERRLETARAREQEAARLHKSEIERGGLELLQRVSRGRDALHQATDRLSSVRRTVHEREAAVADGVFAGKTAKEAADEAESAQSAFSAACSIPRKAYPAAIAAAAVCVVLAVLGALSVLPWTIAAPLCAVLLLAAVFLVLSAHRKSERRTREILSHYAAASPGDIVSLARAHAAALTALDTAQRAEQGAEREVKRREQELREVERELVDRQSETGKTNADLRAAMSETAALERRLAELRGRFSELGDPMVLKTELGARRARLAELQGQYDALELAIENLSRANEELQLRFSPALSRRAGEIMSELTGRRYDRVLFDRQLDARVRLRGDAADHEAAFLSAGTLDQLYLSLRLAVCELAVTDGGACPLVLDDALVNFDGERMERAVDFLKEIARSRQVILFTCHDLLFLKEK